MKRKSDVIDIYNEKEGIQAALNGEDYAYYSYKNPMHKIYYQRALAAWRARGWTIKQH